MESSKRRRLWQLIESIHAVVYFEPTAKSTYERAGLKGYWMGYFASRSAALGPAGPELVGALFFNFHPSMIARSLPDAWDRASSQRVLEARAEVAGTALGHLLADVEEGVIVQATEIMEPIARSCPVAGRPLFAAHAGLEWPQDPRLRLWHACTLMREFRGDGHVACLTAEGLDGCEVHVLRAASGEATRAVLQPNRGWSDEDWDSAEKRLTGRGLIADGALTHEGRRLRDDIEHRTDALAFPASVSDGALDQMLQPLEVLSKAVLAGEGVPFPNPMGLPRPEF